MHLRTIIINRSGNPSVYFSRSYLLNVTGTSQVQPEHPGFYFLNPGYLNPDSNGGKNGNHGQGKKKNKNSDDLKDVADAETEADADADADTDNGNEQKCENRFFASDLPSIKNQILWDAKWPIENCPIKN